MRDSPRVQERDAFEKRAEVLPRVRLVHFHGYRVAVKGPTEGKCESLWSVCVEEEVDEHGNHRVGRRYDEALELDHAGVPRGPEAAHDLHLVPADYRTQLRVDRR